MRSGTVVGDTKPLHGAHEHACLDLMRERFHVTPIVRSLSTATATLWR